MTLLDRLLGREPARKAVYGGPALVAYQNDVPLSVYGQDWQQRAVHWLAAYKVDWFYKAGARISRDFAQLAWTLAYEDAEGDNAEEIVAPANNVPFDSLTPLEQFLRLSEKPNEAYSGRLLKQRQMIRYLMTGRGIYFLEGGDGGGLPTAWYGISPSRMWPSRDPKGQLIGWVMDKNRQGGGVPFTTDEIVVVEDPGTEDDMPQGVVEAVFAQTRLSPMIPAHTADVLSTGGRLAGMLWPKDRVLDEDEFLDAQRAWRNVASDPNAARRLLIMPEPMEYAVGAASPKEIGIPELANLSRDDILTAFPISPYMLGVPMPGGLNSAETRKEENREYWESLHAKVEAFEDAFQQAVIPRYEAAVGRPLDFDIEEPNLDDAESILAKVGALKALISVGFDAKQAISRVELDGISWNGLPAAIDPANEIPPAPAPTPQVGPAANVALARGRMSESVTEAVAKSAMDRKEAARQEQAAFEATMRTFLKEQRRRIELDLERTLGPLSKSARKAPPEWWDQQREDDLLREHLRGLYLRLSRTALQVVADQLNRVVVKGAVGRITERMLEKAASRISGINETTRQAVQDAIAEGVRRGYSINQIIYGVPQETYAGVRDAAVFDEARAELVARTETMLAYNESALRGYDEFGVGAVEAIDGDGDEECAARDGQTFTVEEALDIEDHPNGTLDWIPLTA